MRVLYVDDDRINTLLFAEMCRVVGEVELETAGSGAEALEIAPEWRPDLLVIDLHLPDTDGYALMPALRRALGRADLPAYLCTADEPHQVEAAARRAGYSGWWTKPVRLETVAAALAQLTPPPAQTPP